LADKNPHYKNRDHATHHKLCKLSGEEKACPIYLNLIMSMGFIIFMQKHNEITHTHTHAHTHTHIHTHTHTHTQYSRFIALIE
jgi:hypothetical protein